MKSISLSVIALSALALGTLVACSLSAQDCQTKAIAPCLAANPNDPLAVAACEQKANVACLAPSPTAS